jgi:hypothetical protein
MRTQILADSGGGIQVAIGMMNAGEAKQCLQRHFKSFPYL